MEHQQREVWQRGPIDGIHPLLQPVAHALLQASEEVAVIMKDFPEALLWEKPAGLASVAFHLQHMRGVLDRLCTYARSEALSSDQLAYLKSEGAPDEKQTAGLLVQSFNRQVSLSIEQIGQTDATTLTAFRGVGRLGLPSTVIGLLVHAAEHTMRHLGQLLVTVKVVREKYISEKEGQESK